MKFSTYTTKTVEEVFIMGQTSQSGLALDEAEKRQKQSGKNELRGREVHWYTVFSRQFKSPFLYLLLLAALLALLFGEIVDSIMIATFVAINAFLGFHQEYRSEKTLSLLNKYVEAKSRVMRGGRQIVINSKDLVVGEVIYIKPGDILPADIRFIDTENLSIDESTLTGESEPVHKTANESVHELYELYKAFNIGFSGTTVIRGKGTGVVIAIGCQTEMGKVSLLQKEVERKSTFEKGIARISSFILRLIIVTLVIIFLINLSIKGDEARVTELLIFSIALAVSVIPEALPVVTTFSFSRGALHLARHKVVVRRLSAIEDLGSIEVLCTDKTGTLTENKLTVSKVFQFEQVKKSVLLLASLAVDSNGSLYSTDPFDTAILNGLNKEEKKQLSTFKHIHELPFDPTRRRNSVVVKKNNKLLLVARGAAEEMMAICKNISDEQQSTIHSWIQEEGKKGNRIISVASKSIKSNAHFDLLREERDLTFVGMISFVDPIKKTAQAAIKKAELLGVGIKILTGDSREVAGAVAHQLGIINDPHQVMTGDEFGRLNQDQKIRAVEKYSVFARVTPEQKYAVISTLQKSYEVGFLGEGINDAPALKIANVAMVVAGASDIARESADIVLLQSSLNVIIDGITDGREIFTNTAKYIKATLASNFGNFYTVAIASLLINYLPMLPLQILLVNLLTDFPMIALAADTVDKNELQRPRTYDVHEIARISTILGLVSTMFDLMFFVLFYKATSAVLQTNWFVGSVLTELVFMWSIRSKKFVLKSQRPSAILIALSVIAGVVALFLPYTNFGKNVFKLHSPTSSHLLSILTIVILYFIATELVKLCYYRSKRSI